MNFTKGVDMSSDANAGRLQGKVALVTGGGRGVGRAVALAFAEAGAAVMVTARSVGEIEETASLIRAAGGTAAAHPADVTDLDSLRSLLAATEAELGTPTLLMNNAGGGVPGSSGFYETLEPEAIVAGLQINLVSAMLLTRLALPGMLAAGEGCIINVASGAGMLAMPFLAPYTVGKTGIIRFSEALALELEGRGVSVFSITPGNVLTKLTEPLWPGRQQFIAAPPDGAPWVFPPGHAMEDHGWYPPERAAELVHVPGVRESRRGVGAVLLGALRRSGDRSPGRPGGPRTALHPAHPHTHGIEEPIIYGDHGAAPRSERVRRLMVNPPSIPSTLEPVLKGRYPHRPRVLFLLRRRPDVGQLTFRASIEPMATTTGCGSRIRRRHRPRRRGDNRTARRLSTSSSELPAPRSRRSMATFRWISNAMTPHRTTSRRCSPPRQDAWTR